MRVSRPRIVTRTPDPRIPNRKFTTDPDLPQCPQLRFLRIDGSLFFGSVSHVLEFLAEIEEQYPEQKHLAIVAEGINFTDIAGGDMLVREAMKRKARGGDLYLLHVKKGLWESLDKCCLDELGPNNIFQSKKAAVTAIFQKLDKDICRTCDKRIFQECNSVPYLEPPSEQK
jgi:SulP family sulfate permease